MLSSKSSSKGAVAVGRIARAHGVRGALRVQPYDSASKTLAGVEEVLLQGRAYAVRSVRAVPDAWLLELDGVTTREQADALRGAEIELARADLDVGASEYLVGDLVGCAAFDRAGRALGRVESLFWNGAHDVLVLDGDGSRMVPLVDEWVLEVDLHERRIVLEPHDAF